MSSGYSLPPSAVVPTTWADRERDRANAPAPVAGPACKNCGTATVVVHSQSAENMGRPFWGCPNYKNDEGCKGFKGWCDQTDKDKGRTFTGNSGQRNNSLNEFMVATSSRLHTMEEALARIEAAVGSGAAAAAARAQGSGVQSRGLSH